MGHLSLCFSLRKNKPNKVAVYLYVSQTWFISPLFIACIGGVLQNKVSSTLLLKEKHKQAEFQNVLPSFHQRPEVIPEAMEQTQSVGVCVCMCARVRVCVCVCRYMCSCMYMCVEVRRKSATLVFHFSEAVYLGFLFGVRQMICVFSVCDACAYARVGVCTYTHVCRSQRRMSGSLLCRSTLLH